MVTDLVSGCIATDQVVVNVIPFSPPQLNLQKGLIACQDPGEWIQIGVSPQPNVIYHWSRDPNSVWQPSDVLSNWSISNPELNISNLAAHQYDYPNYLYLTATDTSLPAQCATTQDSMSYRVILLPNPTMPDDQQICQGDSVQLTASISWPYYLYGINLPLSYAWTPATALSDPGNLITYASPSQTAIYELNVGLVPMPGITLVGCGTTEGEVLVEITPIPQLQVPDLALDCKQGSEDRHLVFPYSTQYSYHWEPEALVSNPNIANPYFIGTESATLTLTGWDANQCLGNDTRCNVMDLDPMAYYRLGEGYGTIAYDEVNDSNGTYSGNPLWISSYVPGDPDLAVDLTNGQLDIPQPAHSSSYVPNQFTLSFIVTAPYYSNSYYPLFQNTSGFNVYLYRGSIRIYYNGYGGYYSSRLMDGKPHHIIIQSTGSRTNVYFDGYYYSGINNQSVSLMYDAVLGASSYGRFDELIYFDYLVDVQDLNDIMKGYIETLYCVAEYTVDVSYGDSDAPDLQCQDTLIMCDADTSVQSIGRPYVSDNCDAAPMVSWNDRVVDGNCLYEQTIFRTWYAEDQDGNIDSCLQTILVKDTISPLLVCPADALLNCPADTTVGATGFAQVTDNCDPSPRISYTDAVTPACGNSFMVERTWQATDTCGNTTTCIQVITVQDTTAPVLSCPADVVLDCPADTSVQ
ncbi:MAG: hypothetical protein IH599_01090, partial [Bacteroidales bacterium]|nr:hypothetical protein [Bacteroidales bacterium]